MLGINLLIVLLCLVVLVLCIIVSTLKKRVAQQDQWLGRVAAKLNGTGSSMILWPNAEPGYSGNYIDLVSNAEVNAKLEPISEKLDMLFAHLGLAFRGGTSQYNPAKVVKRARTVSR